MPMHTLSDAYVTRCSPWCSLSKAQTCQVRLPHITLPQVLSWGKHSGLQRLMGVSQAPCHCQLSTPHAGATATALTKLAKNAIQ